MNQPHELHRLPLCPRPSGCPENAKQPSFYYGKTPSNSNLSTEYDTSTKSALCPFVSYCDLISYAELVGTAYRLCTSPSSQVCNVQWKEAA